MAVHVLRARRRALLLQEGDDLRVLGAACLAACHEAREVERRAPVRVLRLERHAVLREQHHRRQVALRAREVEQRLAVAVGAREVEAGELVPLNLDCKDFDHRFIYAIVRRDQRRSPACEAFINALVSNFPKSEKLDARILKRLRGAQA